MTLTVSQIVCNNSLFWRDISRKIWEHPELSFEEHYAHDLLTSVLENSGFTVQKNYLLPTAFRGTFYSGKNGPTIAIICEYDALPGMGHACGHNLIAEIGIAVGITVKTIMEHNDKLVGKIVVLGTPAEEDGGGKVLMIEKGAFKDIDAVLMAHPQSVDRLCPLIVDMEVVTFKFFAKEDTDPWNGRSAVDAAVLCYHNVTFMRRCLNKRWRISGIIKRSSAQEAELCFCYRAPSRRELHLLGCKLNRCIRTAAVAADCSYVFEKPEDSSGYRGMLFNKTLNEVFAKNATELGICFKDNDCHFCESAVSTDIGNVSHVVPSIHPEFSIGHGEINHSPEFATVAGSEEAQKATLVVIESMAKTAVELLSNPELMTKVKTEFEEDPLRDPTVNFRQAG